ncbi:MULTISPECIES: Mpo1 family 2-hydroxy fatty acid dioxygenase [unclassified Pseudoalteromonas]|jgi:uncharacterized membrane protein YGL010W|uniref:Mpo1 family 2-hydroxy fatty acid dioxygenase n=1 Tax=unclassified Pseudoalteromonas TaxID=194690 RepID=UPI00041E9596|nr:MULTISPECIES: Mpo1-like protein [unclassified Pseudoalteromonas]MDC9521685.1 DUF962 domain-containing protein [Pseudoalteromonas sp. Angola-31]MDY6889283.1 Mpo1-like protein [Pseudomonadota bacterium]MCK8106342.1 DUF962 domain-containing protein [Pseudoalteromonas sp. 2CM41L]MDC9497622.1 DUF962 domain-containing protein [Pseudoalteromonas sp. Angola-20]MDC9516832.1 DUF962 domain-containing protein [Pseudoalteromonas sp. Angola-22]|tara:strand:+ start:363 stop:866 length:504 start_codon:yes stop_codon:yes gene_type:complete
MKTLQQQLGTYGLYHRSKRNVLTHFFGIPLIVFAVLCLLARIQIPIGSLLIDGAQLFVFASVVYYLMLSVSLGLIMGVLFTLLLLAAQPIAAMAFWPWLSIGVGVFVFGWVLQFIGHYYEGKKPAFVDDLIGLIIGPLYVTVELLFLMGLYKSLEHEVNAIAGPTKA